MSVEGFQTHAILKMPMGKRFDSVVCLRGAWESGFFAFHVMKTLEDRSQHDEVEYFDERKNAEAHEQSKQPSSVCCEKYCLVRVPKCALL